MPGAFTAVREAFAASPHENLHKLGITIKQQAPKGDWLAIACPLCPDTSGSASISIQSGHLTCHQCGEKGDLFEWWAKKNSLPLTKPIESARSLGAILGVSIAPPVKVKKRKMKIEELTEEDVSLLVEDLLGAEENEHLRAFLRNRGQFDQALIERLSIGAWQGKILFVQRTPDGRIRAPHRTYDPAVAKHLRWAWIGRRAGQSALCFWPYLGPVPHGAPILIVEGEWDCMSALSVLQVPFAYTWTGGAGAPVHPYSVPEEWRGHKVSIVYDNDTFQGPKPEMMIPHVKGELPEKRLAEAMRRRDNLVTGVALSFEIVSCQVSLLTIPIDPLEKYGADLRDWADGGGKSIDALPSTPLAEVRRQDTDTTSVEFSAMFLHEGFRRPVTTRCTVRAVSADVVLPIQSAIDCEMGQHKVCNQCRAPDLFPSKLIFWQQHQQALAEAITEPDPGKHVSENLLRRPRQCPGVVIRPVEREVGALWEAGPVDQLSDQRTVLVVSGQTPDLSGEVEITGTLYPHRSTQIFLATEVKSRIVAPNLASSSVSYELVSNALQSPRTVEEIDDWLLKRWAGFSTNVTRIRGQHDIFVTVDLVAHSAMWMMFNGKRARAWLDVAMLGPTRTGKSETCRQYLDFIGVGKVVSLLENWSRAGLLTGTASHNGRPKIVLGAFPKAHGKMLVLDEAHGAFSDGTAGKTPFPMMQQARDVGFVEANKMGSSGVPIPAAVRLLTIGNWLTNRGNFRFKAEQFLELYGTPESLARLDFAIGVGEPGEDVFGDLVWSQEGARSSVLRAWDIKPDQIVVEPEALDLSASIIEEWKEQYSEKLPLFTGIEKQASIVRVSIALANILLSGPADLSKTIVKKVHVEWTKKWFERQWKLIGYDDYSREAKRHDVLSEPMRAEWEILKGFGCQSPLEAERLLCQLFQATTRDAVKSLYGVAMSTEGNQWVQILIALGVFVMRRTTPGLQQQIQLSKGGEELVHNMIECARDFPSTFSKRYVALQQASRIANGFEFAKKEMMVMTGNTHLLRQAWGSQEYGTTG